MPRLASVLFAATLIAIAPTALPQAATAAPRRFVVLSSRAAVTNTVPPMRTSDYREIPYTIGGKTLNIFVGPYSYSGGYGLASGLGGKLWYTLNNYGSSYIASVLPTGKDPVTYTVPGGGYANGIVESPDGTHMWFTENGGPNRYGSITKNGIMTQYSITNSPTTALITAGGDKRLWFGVSGGHMAATDQSGGLTLYPLPNANDSEYGIALGPDGNIWYAQGSGYSSATIGKITPDGTATDFALGFLASGIAPGNDKIWLGAESIAQIASVTTSGTGLTTYGSGISGLPISIITGPDGNEYFSEYVSTTGQAAVAKLVPASGAVTEYALPYGFKPSSVVVGPDKNIWVLDSAHDQLGQLVLPKKK